MTSHLRPAIVMIVLFTLLTGLAYPLAVTGVAQAVLPYQAGGSVLRRPDGAVEGSALLAQNFAGARYLHPRGSSAGAGYDATSSSGSNLGPMDRKLWDRVAGDAAALRKESTAPIPADAVTQSGSGLDPDISPANAERQASRIARARGLSAEAVRTIIARNTSDPALGFLGEPAVHVLAVNQALDQLQPAQSAR
jgi:potassium-transporting ATPase KdpC subunit